MIIATLLTAALAFALIIAALAIIRVATTREYRQGQLQAHATTRLAAIARKITGLYVEVPPPPARPCRTSAMAGADAGRPEQHDPCLPTSPMSATTDRRPR